MKSTSPNCLFSRFEESLADFQHAFKELRGNQLIDYKALGLRHKLYACEVSVSNAHQVATAEHTHFNIRLKKIFYKFNQIIINNNPAEMTNSTLCPDLNSKDMNSLIMP